MYAPRLLALVLCAVGLLPTTTAAQTDPSAVPDLSVDRPGFTESSDTVGRGFVQFEMGTSYEWSGHDGNRDRIFTAPLALMRVGLSKRLELRFSTDGYMLDTYGFGAAHAVTRGETDLEVGAKLVLFDHRHPVQLALIPMASLPTGKTGVTSGTVDPTVKVTWSADLPHGFDVSGNMNVERLGDTLGRYTESALTFSLGKALGERWSAYWETFGFLPKGRPGTAAWTVDGGITRTVGGNVQLDVEMGRGITASAPDWFISGGIGIRTAPFRSHR